MKNRVVTISREFGSGGRTIGRELAARLGIPCYDEEVIEKLSERSGYSREYIKERGEYAPASTWIGSALAGRDRNGYSVADSLWRVQSDLIQELAEKGPCVIVGRCADVILRNEASLLRVFISANEADRIAHVCKRDGVNENEAAAKLRRMDRERRNYYNGTTDGDWGHASSYDLCLNTSVIGRERCVEIIVNCALAE